MLMMLNSNPSGDPAGDCGDVPHVQRAQADPQYCWVYPQVENVRELLSVFFW